MGRSTGCGSGHSGSLKVVWVILCAGRSTRPDIQIGSRRRPRGRARDGMGLRTRAFRTFRTLAGTVLAVLVLLLLGASRVVAQAPARTMPITGTVIDPSGAGAAGVMVSLKQGASAVLLSTQTDTAGRFRFDA